MQIIQYYYIIPTHVDIKGSTDDMVRGGKMETAVIKPKIFMPRPGIDLKTTLFQMFLNLFIFIHSHHSVIYLHNYIIITRLSNIVFTRI